MLYSFMFLLNKARFGVSYIWTKKTTTTNSKVGYKGKKKRFLGRSRKKKLMQKLEFKNEKRERERAKSKSQSFYFFGCILIFHVFT